MLILKSPHLLFIFVAIGLIISPAVSSADADNIFKENSKAVVVVVTFDEEGELLIQGSGFIVRADGVIVTNYHVISNAKDIKVKAASSKSVSSSNMISGGQGFIHCLTVLHSFPNA